MKLSNLLKFKAANQRIVSIDFGSSSIKIAHLEARGNKFALLAYIVKEIDSAQRSTEELGTELKEALSANSINTKEAFLSISNPEQVFIKKLTLPQMPKDELLEAVKWKLKGEFTFAPDESIAGLQIVREYTDSQAAKKIELFCIFAKRESINKYLSIAASAGLKPLRVSSNAFNYSGILNAITPVLKVCAILDIGHTHSEILIYQDNKLSFLRGLNFSTSRLSASLVQTLITDKGKVAIDPQRGRQIMRQYGIISDESVKLEDDIRAGQIIPLMRPLLEILVKELDRSFDFFNSESALGAPQVLYLTGGGANLNNLSNYLSDQLKIRVEKLPLPQEVLEAKNINPDALLRDSNQLSAAIGLGLTGAGINLLPPEIKSQKAELIQKSTLRVAAIAVSAIFIFSWFVVSFQTNDYKKRLKIAQLHLQSLEEVKGLKQMVEQRQNYVDMIHDGKVPSGGLLKLIGALIPASIILDEFDFNELNHSMYIKGVVAADAGSVEKLLTDFMNALEDSDFVNEANLLGSKEDQGVHNFEIECELAK